jgi:serine/threonine-protein kinase RsbT
MIRVLCRHQIDIQSEDDVIRARRKAQGVAQERRFDAFAVAALTTATSELSRNIWRHAQKGSVIIEEIMEDERFGLRIEFCDQGPGIPDIGRVLAGGYSTAGSLGLGLSGSKRLVDHFAIQSSPDGTRIVIIKWKRH